MKKAKIKTKKPLVKKGKVKSSGQKKTNEYKAWSKERTKDNVMSLRINGEDLALLQAKAAKKGIKYQTYIGDILTREAQKAK